MKSTRWIAILPLCIGFCLGAWWFMRVPDQVVVRLKDGTVLRFEKVGKGSIPYDTYPQLKAMISRFLPARYQHHLGTRIQGILTVQDNCLGILVSRWGADGKPLQSDDDRVFSKLEFVDSTGFVFTQPVSGYSSTGNLVLMDASVFPRRERQLKIRCYERESDRLLFDIQCLNPFYAASFETWEPQSPPISQTNSPLTVTLKRGPAEIKSDILDRDNLVIESSDPKWTEGPLRHTWWLTDATGNRTYSFDRLSPFEPAWKIHFKIHRVSVEQFESDEVWRTERIPIPKSLEFQELNLKSTVQGVPIRLFLVASAGTLKEDSGSQTMLLIDPSQQDVGYSSGVSDGKQFHAIHSGLPFIKVSRPHLDAETELILTVRDQTGAVISKSSQSWYKHNRDDLCILQFEPNSESTHFEFEVIVNRGRTFEFLVAPPKPVNIP